MRPLKIATLHSSTGGSFLLRCQAPIRWLQRQDAVTVIPPLKAWEADIVIFHDQWQPGILDVMRSLQQHGIRVGIDVDGDLVTAPDAEFQERARKMMETADALFVPSEAIAAKLSGLNSKVLVNPTGIDLEPWWKTGKGAARDQVRVVGFAASPSDAAGLEIVRPALAKLAYKFKEQGIRLVCLGFQPDWLHDVCPGADLIPAGRSEEYPARLASLGLDIALAPLAIAGLTESRSALKFWEYTMAGAVTIASNLEPYASEIADRSTGLLVNDRRESWSQAIWTLIDNAELRRDMLASARRAVEKHDLARTAPRMLDVLEATEPNRERTIFACPRTQAEECRNVDVVIAIHNAPELARQAIEVTLPELDAGHRVVLADDASTDADVALLLDEYSTHPWVVVHRSQQRRGLVETCNLAAQEWTRPGADLILVKPAVCPMPGFIGRLAHSAGSNPAIGTVTAVSNQGSIASVPDVSDALQLALELAYPLVVAPTAVSHLMYVKREVIRKYGLFDMEFSPSYGEEVDFSLRISNDYVSVIDPGCWCLHPSSDEAEKSHKPVHDALIHRRYPHYSFQVQSFLASDPLLPHRRKMLSATRDPRPRVLHVLHSRVGGGTEKHVQDLAGALSTEFLSIEAAPQESLTLYCGDVTVGNWRYTQPGWPLTSSELPENDETWAAILKEVKPDLIHFHHLLRHPLSLLSKLASTGIPIVASIHDYYFLCPDYTLQFCPGVHSCETCFPQQFKGPAMYQTLRRTLLGESLRQIAAIIAPSQAAANLVREVYPDLNIRVISHGIREIPAVVRQPASKVRFGMLGTVSLVKGIEVILKAWPQVIHHGAAELHVYGNAPDPKYIRMCEAAGIHYHGAYSEADLPGILARIDVGVLPSQQPETFCYALSEFFSGGVPVLGSDYGALSTRIQDGVNGLKAPRDNIQAWVDALELLTRDHALRERITQGVRAPDSIDQMAGRYSDLYREIMSPWQGMALPHRAVPCERVLEYES